MVQFGNKVSAWQKHCFVVVGTSFRRRQHRETCVTGVLSRKRHPMSDFITSRSYASKEAVHFNAQDSQHCLLFLFFWGDGGGDVMVCG